MTITLQETLKQLEALGNEKMRAQNRKRGGGDEQFGVRLGDVRKLAKEIENGDRSGRSAQWLARLAGPPWC